MIQNDLKFFTNEPERDLYSRFANILKSNTQFFDVLVGYFRTSGFFKMYKSLEPIEKVRVLVGINVDKYTIQIIDRAENEIKYNSISGIESRNIMEDQIEREFEEASTTEEIEKGVRIFIDWLKEGKIEMRMYTEAPIHAKVYIMRKNPEIVPDTFGTVITGSSNFSEAGLVNNLEFNVELKDAADVHFALDTFEKLWEKSIDIKDTYIESVEEKTWMKNDITPYQLYLKTLYEFFKEEINSDKETYETLLPDGYMKLQYQIDAVTQARQKLNAYNGVFISDVVGLGKTYICAMLANSFNRNAYKLIICPPVLVDYWRGVLQEFDVARCDVESLGKLDKIIEKGTDKYSYVFIDEAHRFRNSNTDSFTKLHQICRDKKVILISATPINNYTTDIENQIYLFQAKQSGTINGIKNIEGFFRTLNSKLNKFTKGTPEHMNQLRLNSDEIRDKLIREVMIRRTRGEIEKYYEKDLKQQGLTFPKVGVPKKIIYTFDKETDWAFNETIKVIKDFKYTRYTPLLYLKNTKEYSTMLASQRNMGGFMKGILVKRLESSFFAFRMTLGRFIESYIKFINMAKTGEVYISKKVDVYDLLDGGNIDELLFHIEQEDVMKFKTNDFNDEFIKNLELDLNQLNYLKDLWKSIESDPKLEEFKYNLINNNILKKEKIIVFTESTETANYLKGELEYLFKDRIIAFSGQSSSKLKSEIEYSFNPKYKDDHDDKFDLLITTDVLAEGINLHRAGIIINYDLPWNPTRIMQRVGRINRVGTDFERIHVFNFFPTAQSKKQMPLESRILEKLQSFHDTLGEDFKYLSDEEEVSSKKLFSDLNKNLDSEEETTNPELAYLAIIRQIRDNDTELFERIKRLPKKAKSGKKDSGIESESTISFIRKGALKSFFISNDKETKHISFIEAIKHIEAKENDKIICVGKSFYDEYDNNNRAFDRMLEDEEIITSQKAIITGNDSKVIKLLKALKNEPRLTDIQEANLSILIKRWSDGEMPSKISKDIIKKSTISKDSLELYYEIFKLIPDNYLTEKKNNISRVEGHKQIILSSYLINEE